MITRQEMFDRAYRGLASQGWRTSYDNEADMCKYSMPDGRRCAWGWIDLSLTDGYDGMSVTDLAADNVGLAADLLPSDLEFANKLQQTHDGADDAWLKSSMEEFAARWKLSIPDVG